ncbi:MSMEG_4193 family putative phosphomutase [Branchiibius sp. NY16-3462-2]|uniref:MSMEG_4193 family putative phosphomutase n=1 Tax=Branchiibius sp. NY16-3462-2 TaxID=1807500 RepID=UPI000793DC35|nr:MSMEG_4193 family putative phosphomutase [Branchiibius sp. NY16-3462-2]KYH44453.1 phosphoglycerate mutase [Branchiibius sp. NY16-3462-2]
MALALIVRHGRTAANASGTLAGWTPGVGLDDVGREQAQRVGARVADLPIRRIVASPLQRCQETAGAVRGVLDVPIETVDDLGECKYGAWTGQPIRDLAKDPLWRIVQDQPSAVTFPASEDFEAESMRAMQARAVGAMRRIDHEVTQEFGDQAIWLAVSHGDVIKAILADALGTHLDQFQRISVGPASLSAVRYGPTRPFVVRMNDTGGDVSDLIPKPEHAPEGDAPVGGGS